MFAGAASFTTYAEELRPQIEAALDALLPPGDAPPRRLHGALRFSVFAGGKRVRPILLVLAGESLGASRSLLLAPAACLELIHTYSLIHDDLPALDDDDLRRGRPTLHRQYDEATAILAGDALLTLGLGRLAAEPVGLPAEVRALATSRVCEAIGTGGMIGGQMDDLEAERAWPAEPAAALERIHRLKTGALITVALRLGGLYAGIDEEVDHRLAALGERVGLMFQIADDILDVEGTAGTLGKTAGKDAVASKLTFPGLYGLAESRVRLARLQDEALGLAREMPGSGLLSSLVEYLSARRS